MFGDSSRGFVAMTIFLHVYESARAINIPLLCGAGCAVRCCGVLWWCCGGAMGCCGVLSGAVRLRCLQAQVVLGVYSLKVFHVFQMLTHFR